MIRQQMIVSLLFSIMSKEQLQEVLVANNLSVQEGKITNKQNKITDAEITK